MYIDYRLEKSVLGWLLVAATELGICLLMLDDSKDELLQELEKGFRWRNSIPRRKRCGPR